MSKHFIYPCLTENGFSQAFVTMTSRDIARQFSCFKFPPATPAFFKKELENQDAIEGDDITLRCELSKPGVCVEWRKGGAVLAPGKKCELWQEGCIRELRIKNLDPEDSGYYTCDAGDQLTTASVTVQGSVLNYCLTSLLVFLGGFYV